MFRFGAEHALYGLLLVPAIAWLLWQAQAWKRRALEQFGEPALVRRLSASFEHRDHWLKPVLILSSITLLVTALARPQFGIEHETMRREGQDIIVALDVSSSMLAEDLKPNRLERAKRATSQLLGGLAGDRIGLVAFAGQAFVQSPLTSDYATAQLFLNAMEPSIIPVQGTNIATAIGVSLKAFDDKNPDHRILVLITDGEDHEGEIRGAVDRAIELGVRIYTVGIGSRDAVSIPIYDGQGRRSEFKKAEDGSVVTTKLNQATLVHISERTGGRYLHAGTDGARLGALADEIDALEGLDFETQVATQLAERFQVFLGLGLALLILEILLSERRGTNPQDIRRVQ